MLGHKSDIADGSLRGYEFRKFENIVGDYYVAPKFLEAIVVRLGGVADYLLLNWYLPMSLNSSLCCCTNFHYKAKLKLYVISAAILCCN